MARQTRTLGERLGPAVLGSALILGQWLFLLALEPLVGVGIWFQSEPVVAGLFACGMAAALGLVACRHTSFPFQHPLALISLAMAAWSLLALLVAEHPGQVVLGSPQLGQGIASYLALAVLTGAAITLRRHGHGRLLAVSVGVATVVLGILMTWGGHAWKPHHYPDFLAFHGVFAGLAIAALWPDKRGWMAGAALFLALGIMSENKALLGACVFAAGGLGLWWGAKRLWPHAPARATYVAVVLPPVLLIALTGGILAFSLSFVATGPTDVGAVYTLHSRSLMGEMVMRSLAEAPATLLTGAGWGGFPQALAAHLNLDQVAFWQIADRDTPYWDSLRRVDFHPHNELLETLRAGGLPVAVLGLAFLAVMVATAPRRRRGLALAGALVLAGLQSLWFMPPTAVPVMAVALAGLASPGATCPKGNRGRRLVPPGFAKPLLPLAIALILALSSWAVIDMARAGRPQAAMSVGDTPIVASKPCAPPFADWERGHDHFIWVMHRQGVTIANALEAGVFPPSPSMVARLAEFICAGDRLAGEPGGVLVGLETLVTRANLAFLPDAPWFAETRRGLLAGWGATLDKVAPQLDSRTDLFIPYFSFLLASGQNDEFENRALAMIQAKPNDPVALWFGGIAALGRADAGFDGLAAMNRALDRGIARMTPLDAAIVQQVREQSRP